MPTGGRFGPQQVLGSTFAHSQHQPSHFPPHLNQHHAPSGALPPPTQLGNHLGFSPASTSTSLNSFQPGVNGISATFNGSSFGGGGGAGLGAAAQLGFHNAQIPPQHHRDALRRPGGAGKGGKQNRIRDVWASNLAQEMQNLRELVEKYPYISMDTEFPGVVVRPMGAFQGPPDYHYQTLRANVDLLKVIQLGITLFNEDGEMPPPHPEHSAYQNSTTPCPSTWQFNFKFNTENDMYSAESIEFLQNHGLNMDFHASMGISPEEFGAALMSSGLVMLDDTRWISFHAGYDFAYLIKLLYPQPLPQTEIEYRKLLRIFFPAIYDIKYMVKTVQRTNQINNMGSPPSQTAVGHLQNLGAKNALQDLADELSVRRTGTAHNAGSDSLLTGKTFWELKNKIFGGMIDDERFLGHVWGLVGHNQAGQKSITSGSTQEGRGPAAEVNGSGMNGTTPSTPKTSASGGTHTPGNGVMTPGARQGGAFGHFALSGR